MTSASEITIVIKDSEKSLRSKFLVYEAYSISEDDPIIKDCVARALKDFNAEPEHINLKVSLCIL